MTTTFVETLHNGYGQCFTVDELLFEHRTEHQELLIFRNATFGRVMALDGIVQTTERDEFIYHEMLTHLPLLAHGGVARVLIIGGGDGGMLREVLKHPTVEAVTQVEIDQAVIDMCRRYLPNHSAGAFDDPRANVVIADGVDFVRDTSERYDLIISDCTDPVGPGEVLFTSEFYAGCKRCLNPGGVFVAQNGVAFLQLDEVLNTHHRLSPLFADQSFYCAAVPTYAGGLMTFAWASDDPALRQVALDALDRRYRASGIRTRYYNPQIHAGSFALPQYILDAFSGS
ncbi:polyamine aminopropyltransferase [Marinobacterium zhoushanense]|uniref:Polyamine aminopropyltransferase n=1 Tax=Marinobacterium zhoushanense TaxID=1679163 RepID=A0ABQ1KB02_9GAMM|nr:polyamine aminopropyltransferase [Marinobacterium zhoushanense]GGB90348.1 polyamine aminopropyltransferase [Marinobacterium zhoushanense]